MTMLAVWTETNIVSLTHIKLHLSQTQVFTRVGFEHSAVNMYGFPITMIGSFVDWKINGVFQNLVLVTAENIARGAMVAVSYQSILSTIPNKY